MLKLLNLPNIKTLSNMSKLSKLTGESVSDLQWFLAEIDRLPDGPGTKAAVLDLLVSMAGQRIYFSRHALLRSVRVAEVARWLDAGMTRTQARDRLIRKYAYGKTKCYEILNEARTVRPLVYITENH